MPQFLNAARDAISAKVTFTWVDDYDFLAAHRIMSAVPWVMLRGNNYGHLSATNAKSVAAGLGFRPLATTVRDTLAWWGTVPEARRTAPRFTITAEQEQTALAEWKKR
jgi:2'-hydroxyisoflavone reductase